jgi:hypothetical protein
VRIRSTKPEFWRSKDIAGLTFFARLLFLGLWNYVDDNGVGEDDESLIRADLFPRDDVQEASRLIHGGLTELSFKGLIARYTDSRNGRKYLAVTGWQHQRINKPTRSSKPTHTSEHAVFTEGSVPIPGMFREDSVLELGNKVTREQGSVPPARPSPFCKQHPHGTTEDCGGCARARLQCEERGLLVAEATATQARTAAARLRDCDDCDEHGLIETDLGMARCNHGVHA